MLGHPFGSQELDLARTTSLTHHDGNSREHDGGNQLPDPAWEGRQRTQHELGGDRPHHSYFTEHFWLPAPSSAFILPPHTSETARNPPWKDSAFHMLLAPASTCGPALLVRQSQTLLTQAKEGSDPAKRLVQGRVPTGHTTLSHSKTGAPPISHSPCSSLHMQ